MYKMLHCIKCIEMFEANHEVCRKKVIKLQNLLRNAFAHKYCKAKVQEEQFVAKDECVWMTSHIVRLK